MEMLKQFGPAYDPSILAELSSAFERGDEIPPKQLARMIRAAAHDIVRSLRSSQELIELFNDYQRVREKMLADWHSLPFETRMGARELVLSVSHFTAEFRTLPPDARAQLIAAMPIEAQHRFLFANTLNMQMASDLTSALKDDRDILGRPTVDQVWDMIKRLSPKMEDALLRPLEPSKYVRRDMEKTPRRHHMR